MPKIVIHPTDPTMHLYWDIATQEPNAFWIKPDGSGWSWSGDFEKPTVTPSILNTDPKRTRRNHIFITDGKIQYLSDCTHALAGQTVDMVDFPDDWL